MRLLNSIGFSRAYIGLISDWLACISYFKNEENAEEFGGFVDA